METTSSLLAVLVLMNRPPVVPRIGSRRLSGEIIVNRRFDGADISKLLLSYRVENSHTHGGLQEEPKLSICRLAHFNSVDQELSRRMNTKRQELRREHNRLPN